MLAYADDLLIFIKDLKEWLYLKGILKLYSDASNAKCNFQKTVMFSITGSTHEVWKYTAETDKITWYDKNNAQAITYLGYPLYSSVDQLNMFLLNIEQKLTTQINIFK